jgi:hypothetical protein
LPWGALLALLLDALLALLLDALLALHVETSVRVGCVISIAVGHISVAVGCAISIAVGHISVAVGHISVAVGHISVAVGHISVAVWRSPCYRCSELDVIGVMEFEDKNQISVIKYRKSNVVQIVSLILIYEIFLSIRQREHRESVTSKERILIS